MHPHACTPRAALVAAYIFNLFTAPMDIISIVAALDSFRRTKSSVSLKHRIMLSAVFCLHTN